MAPAEERAARYQGAFHPWAELHDFVGTDPLDRCYRQTLEAVATTFHADAAALWARDEDGEWRFRHFRGEASPAPTALLESALASGEIEIVQSSGRAGSLAVALGSKIPLILWLTRAEGLDLADPDLGFLRDLGLEIDRVCRAYRDRFHSSDHRRDVERRLREQTRELRRLLRRRHAPIAQHPSMRSLLHSVERLGTSPLPVLITGETGTGKEVVARLVHRISKRPGPLVVVDCGAIPGSLLESELFGYERGAFTGAATQRKGRFEEADGGTLVLDEIGELPLTLQPSLLRVLQDSMIRRIGGNESIQLDFRVVAATHRNLHKMVAAGTFREDLFFRLKVVEIELPPLRERGEDIVLLALHFIREYCAEMGRDFMSLTDDATEALMSHSWPGNVRELQNALRSAIVAATGPDLTAADIKLEPTRHRNGAPRAARSRSPTASAAASPPPRRAPTAASPAPRVPAAPERPGEVPSPRGAGDGGLDGDLADWFWDRWARLEEPRCSPCEAIDAHLIRSALARAGGSLGEAGALLGLSAETFGRSLDRIGSSSAALAVRGHPIAEHLDRALGGPPVDAADDKPPLRDRCRQLVLREMLVFCRGNKSEMARVLGWGRRTLVRELQRLEVI